MRPPLPADLRQAPEGEFFAAEDYKFTASILQKVIDDFKSKKGMTNAPDVIVRLHLEYFQKTSN